MYTFIEVRNMTGVLVDTVGVNLSVMDNASGLLLGIDLSLSMSVKVVIINSAIASSALMPLSVIALIRFSTDGY
jgi:hypothetical protein